MAATAAAGADVTQHDPKVFDQALDTALLVPAHRLLAICRQLAPAYERRTTIPVLGMALIEAGEEGTTFRLTDLDLTIAIVADDLKCAAPFKACVPFGLLRQIAGTLDDVVRIGIAPGDTLTHRMDQLTIATDDGFSAAINLLCPPEDWPTVSLKDDTPENWSPISISPGDLRKHIDLARHCISTEETRYYLNGVYLCRHPVRGTVRSVATDGHRMAVIDTMTDAPEKLGAIVPRACLQAITTLISPTGNEPISLALHKLSPRIRLTAGPITIDCKLIDGDYPDYTRVIPKEPARTILTLSAGALRRLAPYATQRSNAVTFKDGRATMKALDLGEVSTPVSMTEVDGQAAEGAQASNGPTGPWGFNLRYLVEQARLTPTFRAELHKSGDPARIYGEDPDAMWIIMPMRV